MEDNLLNKQKTVTKLYCPLKILIEGEEGCLEKTSSEEIKLYEDEINRAIKKSMQYDEMSDEERERGLIAYIENESLSAVVFSAFPSVERRDDELYGVVTVVSYGELSEADRNDLEDQMIHQFSDEWGESFQQQAISLKDNRYYICFYDCEKGNFLKPESEMFPQQNMTLKM